jgi:plastocyanin
MSAHRSTPATAALASIAVALLATAGVASAGEAGPAAEAAGRQAGTVAGTVTFVGKPPPRKIINTASDPGCRAHKPPRTEEVVLDKAGGLKNAVVYVKQGLSAAAATAAAAGSAAPREPVVIDQADCRYEPHVAAVRVGQPLKVTNGDATMHNVHGLPLQNNQFNVVQLKQGAENTFTFEAPEQPGFVLKCDVHPWMLSYVWVFDHPYFAITKEDGSFTLPPLPPGTYTVGVWQEACVAQEREVKVDAAGKVDLSFKLELMKK